MPLVDQRVGRPDLLNLGEMGNKLNRAKTTFSISTQLQKQRSTLKSNHSVGATTHLITQWKNTESDQNTAKAKRNLERDV
jgi:hypothetical protein